MLPSIPTEVIFNDVASGKLNSTLLRNVESDCIPMLLMVTLVPDMLNTTVAPAGIQLTAKVWAMPKSAPFTLKICELLVQSPLSSKPPHCIVTVPLAGRAARLAESSCKYSRSPLKSIGIAALPWITAPGAMPKRTASPTPATLPPANKLP